MSDAHKSKTEAARRVVTVRHHGADDAEAIVDALASHQDLLCTILDEYVQVEGDGDVAGTMVTALAAAGVRGVKES